MRTFSWEELQSAHLVVDACYQGQRHGNAGDDPLTKLIGVSNQGGFRYLGSLTRPSLVVLTSSQADPDWPDELDPETGVFTYFGDNKKPGRELHDTPRFGNRLLRDIFNASHGGGDARKALPPILVFTSAGAYRDVVFRGLAVPGAPGLSPVEDLVAVWKVKSGQRFQNYRARFTILSVPVLSREWLNEIRAGSPLGQHSPEPWRVWVERGFYRPLRARPSVEIRSRDEQLPSDPLKQQLLASVHARFAANPFAFEACACRIVQLHLNGVTHVDLTRPYRDGGRDALGGFRIGVGGSSISVEFALEAKCYSPENAVGVQQVSRLIARLRHRQFGIIVTTSYINTQAYREIREDGHPILVISGGDLVDILVQHGITSRIQLEAWLSSAGAADASVEG